MPRYILTTENPLTPAQIEKIVKRAQFPTVRDNPNGPGLVQDVTTATLTPEQKTLHIVGRRWFQKSYGNTYHTVEIFIDGQKVFKSPRQYGYGDQYLTTASEWLKNNGHIPETASHIGTRFLREESGYKFSYDCHDVTRQKDL